MPVEGCGWPGLSQVFVNAISNMLTTAAREVKLTLKPEPGHAIMFPSNWCYPHSGQEVISGKKRIAVTWYYVDWA